MNGEAPAPGRMNVTAAIDSAIQRTKKILFHNFDIGTWLRFGLIILLASLANGGGSGGGGGGRGGGAGGDDFTVPSQSITEAKEWVADNLGMIVVIGGIVLAVVVFIILLTQWLASHGQLMFVRSVALADPLIGRNWQETNRLANSLFAFRVVLCLVGLFVGLILFVSVAAIVFGVAATGSNNVSAYLIPLIPVILVAVALVLVFSVINSLLGTFVVPLMYRFDAPCITAWGHFRTLSRGNIGPIVLFFLIRFAYYIGFAMASFLVGCVTCCIGWLPYIHHTLFAPFYLFDRAYSLYIIESAGPEYRFIIEEETVPAIPNDYEQQIPPNDSL